MPDAATSIHVHPKANDYTHECLACGRPPSGIATERHARLGDAEAGAVEVPHALVEALVVERPGVGVRDEADRGDDARITAVLRPHVAVAAREAAQPAGLG